MRALKISFILVGVMICGCTSESDLGVPDRIEKMENITIYPTRIANAQQDGDIELIRERTLGNDDSTYFGVIGEHIVVDDNGRVFIGDYQRQGIHIFERNGEYMSFIGGEGSGPGEFRAISSMRIVANKLCVYDSRMMRMTEIDLDSLAQLEVKPIRPPSRESMEKITGVSRMGIGDVIANQDGLLLVEFYPPAVVSPSLPGYNLEDKRYSRYYLMDYEGEILSERLFKLRNRILIPAKVGNARRFNAGYAYEFLGKPLMAVSDDDHIYTAWTENFMVRTFGPDGEYLHAFYYPHETKRLERQEAIQNVKDFGGDNYYQGWVQKVELPETWPALSYMVTDDENRLWISTIAGSYEHFNWWVLDDTGRLLASFTWPRNRVIAEVRNGHVYSVEKRKTGEKQVVQYSVEKLGEE